jgi:hypothetical protein
MQVAGKLRGTQHIKRRGPRPTWFRLRQRSGPKHCSSYVTFHCDSDILSYRNSIFYVIDQIKRCKVQSNPNSTHPTHCRLLICTPAKAEKGNTHGACRVGPWWPPVNPAPATLLNLFEIFLRLMAPILRNAFSTSRDATVRSLQ